MHFRESVNPKPAQIDEGGQKEKTALDRVREFVRRFVFLPSEEWYSLIGIWIIGTHLHTEFDYFGYLFAHSPERQCGKSVLLDVLDMLVHHSSGVQLSPTRASMFRTAQDHTQLFDEVDSWTNQDDVREILNAGFKQGGAITRCEQGDGHKFDPAMFSVYAPRALAGIGVQNLHPTTRDRTFALAMVRQTKAEKRERLRGRRIRNEATDVKREIQEWTKANKADVSATYLDANFPYLDQFTDRTMDIAEPLASVIEVMYRNCPLLPQIRATLTSAIASTRKEQQSASPQHHVLIHLMKLSQEEDPLIGNASELAALCANLEQPADDNAISDLLRKYEFTTKSCRKGGESPRYRYILTYARLKDLVERWVPDWQKQSADSTVEAV